MERQKPGNDFDKVTAHRPTTRRIKKKLPIVGVSRAHDARKFISATLGRRGRHGFQAPFKADERARPLRARHGVAKSNAPGMTLAAGALVSRIYEKYTPPVLSSPSRRPAVHIAHRLVTHIQLIFR